MIPTKSNSKIQPPVVSKKIIKVDTDFNVTSFFYPAEAEDINQIFTDLIGDGCQYYEAVPIANLEGDLGIKDPGIRILLDEEGKLAHKPINHVGSLLYHSFNRSHSDAIVGNILFVGTTTEDFDGIPEDIFPEFYKAVQEIAAGLKGVMKK